MCHALKHYSSQNVNDDNEPAQRVEGAILGREGGYTYTVNGAWVSREGMGRTIAEWERLRNWGPSLAAWRRCHTPQPVVLPMGAEPVTAWGRRRQGEEVGE